MIAQELEAAGMGGLVFDIVLIFDGWHQDEVILRTGNQAK